MHPYKSTPLTAVPQTLEKRLEVVNAIRALTANDGDQIHKRRAEIAALRGDLEELRQHVLQLWRQSEPRARSYVIKYSPDQPRVSAGNPEGGQLTSEGAGDVDSATAVEQSPPPKTTPEENPETADVRSIIDTARQLNISARPDAYEKCLNLCYPLLERFQPPGSDRNTWDFHKCMNACLGRNL
jgi:hypothetical protein